MGFTFAEGNQSEQTRRKDAAPKETQKEAGPTMDALRAGLVIPPPDPPDNRDRLAEAMRAKMERVTGPDLSVVRRYSGAAGGFASLRTETAAGQRTAMPTMPLSSASAASAAGPLQAKKDGKKPDEEEDGIELDDLGAITPEEDAPQETKPVSNGLFEQSFKGVSGASQSITDSAKQLSDPDQLRTGIGGAADAIGMKNTADNAINWMEKKGVTNFAKDVSNVTPLIGSSAAMPSAVMDLGGSFDNLEKAEEYGTESDVTDARLKLAGSGLGAAKTGTSFTKSVADQFGSNAAKAVSTGAKQAGSVLGIAGNSVNMIRNAYGIKENADIRQRMKQSVEAQKNTPGPLSQNDQKIQSIYEQTGENAGLNETRQAIDLASDALGAGSAIANTAGGAPVGTALSTVKTVVDTVGNEVMSYLTDQFHTETARKEYAPEQAYQKLRADDRLKAFHVSEKDSERATYRLHGASSGKADEAFENLSDERRNFVLEAAENKEQWALDYLRNLGLDPENLSKTDQHRKAVSDSVLNRLGGNKDAEFHSSNVLEYNAFQKAADENAEAEKRGFWGNVKYQAKQFGRNTWESVKTGGRKALSAVKGTWNLAKKGAAGAADLASRAGRGVQNAAAGVKDFMTSADTRQKAWETLKTGAGNAAGAVKKGLVNTAGAVGRGVRTAAAYTRDLMTDAGTRQQAWNSVRTGASKAAQAVGTGLSAAGRGIAKAGRFAWNVGKHSVTSRIDDLKEWYREGVDQLNVHKDTYDKMGVLDRAAWTMKNLPARLTYDSRKNQEATHSRFVKGKTADEAMALMSQLEAEDEEEEEKKRLLAAQTGG